MIKLKGLTISQPSYSIYYQVTVKTIEMKIYDNTKCKSWVNIYSQVPAKDKLLELTTNQIFQLGKNQQTDFSDFTHV